MTDEKPKPNKPLEGWTDPNIHYAWRNGEMVEVQSGKPHPDAIIWDPDTGQWWGEKDMTEACPICMQYCPPELGCPDCDTGPLPMENPPEHPTIFGLTLNAPTETDK